MKRKITFSENEYLSIRSEMIERIKLLNSQSFTALATIISFWAAGFTFKIALMSKNIYFSEINEKIIIEFLSAIIFLIPLFLFIPLSVKSGENLTQIASLSAYIRVFYDYPICCNKRNKNWETSNNLLSNSNVDRKNRSRYMKFYNGEYTILAVISFVIYLIFEILNIKSVLSIFYNQKIGGLDLHIIVSLYLLINIIAIFAIVSIHKVACMKNTMMNGTIYYMQGYIKRANQLGIIKDKDMEKAISELNPKKEFALENYFDEY